MAECCTCRLMFASSSSLECDASFRIHFRNWSLFHHHHRAGWSSSPSRKDSPGSRLPKTTILKVCAFSAHSIPFSIHLLPHCLVVLFSDYFFYPMVHLESFIRDDLTWAQRGEPSNRRRMVRFKVFIFYATKRIFRNRQSKIATLRNHQTNLRSTRHQLPIKYLF